MKNDEQHDDHERDGERAQGEHAAAEVVVEIAEEHRCPGGHDRRVLEVERRAGLLHEAGVGALFLDRQVALEPDDHLRMRRVRHELPRRPADLALVVVEEEREPCRVVHRPLVLGDLAEPAERLACVGLAGEELGRVRRLAAERAEDGLSDHAAHRIDDAGAVLGLRAEQQVVRELEGRPRRDDRHEPATLREPIVQRVELGLGVGLEELVDGVAVVHRDQDEHRRPAEQRLVLDVVLVDLVRRVQVAVLARGELEPGDPEAEDDGERHDAEGDPPRVLAELDRQPVPQPVHAEPQPFGPPGAAPDTSAELISARGRRCEPRRRNAQREADLGYLRRHLRPRTLRMRPMRGQLPQRRTVRA